MTPYESWLRAACKNALIPGYLEKSVEVLVIELREKPEFWRMWVNKTGGNPYPPNDSRKREYQPGRNSESSQRNTTPVTEMHRSRWTDPITFSIMWDENGNIKYPETRKQQIKALQLEVKRETNPDGTLSGKGRLMQAQLDYLRSQET